MRRRISRKHPKRCSRANPKSRCKCRCGGAKHGHIGKKDNYERTVNERLGGEIELVMFRTPSNILCECGHSTRANFLGYPHDGGLSDMYGNKWWLFVECHYCGMQISWKKFNKTRSLYEC